MIEIAIDIGGTFTDIVCLHDQQRLFLAKVPTTPHDLVQEVRQGVARVLELAGQSAAAVGAQAVAAFHAAHQQVYEHSRPTHAVEFVNLRSVYSASLPRPQLTVQAPSSSLDAACKGMRPAYFDEYQAYCDTPLYQRDLLPLGAQFDGPAIVEQPDTTTVVYSGFACRVDAAGNLLLTPLTR